MHTILLLIAALVLFRVVGTLRSMAELVTVCCLTSTAFLELCLYLTDLHAKLTLTTVMTVFSFSF